MVINQVDKKQTQKYYPIAFVGAGPGDVELITIKGQRLLANADTIVYAGSLINIELLHDSNAEKIDSSGLHLNQIIEVMVAAWKTGKKVVRLHTGDPSIYGAIKEQMQLLDEKGISYFMVPGVSAAFGAAASLKKELTLPEVSQTVIITRMEGRTPVPELEKLPGLASHQATMMIFLSVSMIEKVAEALKQGGYPDTTPVAVVQKATWKDEKIVRGTLSTIAQQVRAENISKTAMICVGQVFDDKRIKKMSKLYDQEFSHGTRS